MRWLVFGLMPMFALGCATQREVVITSRPPDAAISIDGVPRGKAPLTETFSFSNDTDIHTVTASRLGYKEQVIRVARDYERPDLVIELKPRTRKVTFNVTPVPGLVSVDGKALSPDPVSQIATELEFTVDPKDQWITHSVVAQRTGYNKAELKVTWNDTTADYTLPLGAMRKDVNISTSPEGAQIFLNDQALGISPASAPGFAFPVNPDNNEWVPQKLRIVKPGYDPLETTISWDEGKTSYKIELKPHEKVVRLLSDPPGAVITINGAEVKTEEKGAASAHLVFAPVDDKGTLKTYTGVANLRTADAEWEPLPFTIKWDSGRTDYPLALKEIMIRPINLLRVKWTHGDDGWTMAPERISTICNKNPVEPDGSPKLTRISDLPKGTAIDSFAVSPDGSQILINTLLSKSDKDLRSAMLTVKTDGSSGATLFGDDKSLQLTPSFTPDGSQILFSSNRAGRRMSIWEMSAAGDPGITQLTSGDENDLWPVVDSDPKPRLFYQVLADARSDSRLYMTQLGANTRTDLTRAGGMQPRVSPRGDAILFTSVNEKTGKRQIFRMADHGGVPALLTSADADEFDPAWSPDGSRVAFVSDRGVDSDNRPNFDIWVVEVGHADKPIRITRNGSWDDTPQWDPSGQAIYFRSNRGNDWAVWKIAVK